MLGEIGVLPEVESSGCLVRRLRVAAPSARYFETTPPDGNVAGGMLVVPRMLLDAAVCRRAVASGADFVEGVNILGIEREAPGVIMRGERRGAPVSVAAQLAVVATGASTRLLTSLGILRHPP